MLSVIEGVRARAGGQVMLPKGKSCHLKFLYDDTIT